MSNKSRFAFRDVRSDDDLLASGRPPKSIQIQRSNPVSKKSLSLVSAVKKKGGRIFGKFKQFAIKYAAKAALGPVGYAAFKVIDGKFNISGKLGNAISGKLGKNSLSSVSKMASVASIGAKIIEETNPERIRRPLKDGFSLSSSAAAKSLSQTSAATLTSSLISGIPLGSAIPMPIREFKTAASLVKSPRFWNPNKSAFQLDTKEVKLADNAVSHIPASSEKAVLYPQRGLLEDEIMYRLTLVAENVYAPTRQYAIASGYGELTILEGFRGEHTGTSPHETGEAIDFTLGDGSLANSVNCFKLATWMRRHVLYDQLILCFSSVMGGQVWIHVTFTPDARRRQVLTKLFNDLHVEGLHLYGAYSDPTIQAQETANDTENEQYADKLISTLIQRQEQLEPVDVNTVNPVQTMINTITTGSNVGVNRECNASCVVVSPISLQQLSSSFIIKTAQFVKNELINLGMTFKSRDEMNALYDTNFDVYHLELEKYMCIAVVTVRRLSINYPSLGLELYDGPSGVEYNAENNRYFTTFGSLLHFGEVPLPVGVKFAFDTMLFSKHGPSVDMIASGGNIYYEVQDCAAYIDEWKTSWRNPFDGYSASYPTTAEFNTPIVSPAGCAPGSFVEAIEV